MVMYTTSKAALNKPDFSLDNTQETAFADFYRKMSTRTPGTIRLFDRKDYYSAHGEDALYIADNVYHTKTVLKYFKSRSQSSSGDGLPSCTLSKSVAINFLREAITAKQLRIELWSQASSKGASTSSSSTWELDRHASPGNFEEVEDLLFDASSQNITESPMCLAITFRVKDGIKHVGIAYVDSVDRKLGVTEFAENDIFSNTENLLIQLGVKEVLIPAEEKTTEVEAQKLRKLIERCGIVYTERKKNTFAVKNVEQDLNGLLKGDLDVTKLPVFDQKLAMAACSALIAYLDLLASDVHRGAYELHSHDLSQYMKLDSSAVRALTLMPDPTQPGVASVSGMQATGNIVTGRAGKDSSASLFGLLNKCKTGQGTRLLAMWLKQPLVNLHQIENRQALVELFVDHSNVRNTIRDEYLKLMPDFQRLSKKFLAGRAGLEDVVRVYQAVSKLPEILETLSEIGRTKKRDEESRLMEWAITDEGIATLMDEHYCNSLSVCVENTAKLIELVETTIDFDTRDHQITIKSEFDTSLQEIAKKLEKTKDALNQQFEDAAEDLGFDTSNPKKCPLNFENHQVYGHCFRLTRKEASAIKGKKNYIELANRQNGCFFTTKDLKRLNESHADLQATYERKQSTLAKEVISIAGSYAPSLEEINGVIAHLDVITSFAHVANNAPIAYVKPKVLEKGTGDLILKESRHPCLETLPDINFIPNDVEMKKEESEFQIITGANTGGKSVYLRQIGCIALMAQVGSFVPAEEAQIPIFDCILARVGAGDSQLKGISTFMAEMLETATILKAATRNSLIIIDELGRGTSTYDGFGLAWAISEHIATKIRCFALFATHFHDLTTLSEQVPHVTNLQVMAHVEEKSDSITGRDIVMLYKVKPGISDQSFGIHVAELAKFPDEVVRLAKRKADELEETIEENAAEDANGSHPAKERKFTGEEIAEGTELVAEMLKAWQELKADDLSPEMLAATQDSAMDGGEGEADTGVIDAKVKREMELLKQCFETFQPRLAKSTWAMTALLDTY